MQWFPPTVCRRTGKNEINVRGPAPKNHNAYLRNTGVGIIAFVGQSKINGTAYSITSANVALLNTKIQENVSQFKQYNVNLWTRRANRISLKGLNPEINFFA